MPEVISFIGPDVANAGQSPIPVSAANPLPVLPYSTVTIANVGGIAAKATVIPTVTTSVYAIGKQIGGIMTFASVLAPTTFIGLLESITLTFKGSLQTNRFVVALFTASPAGTFTDFSVPAIAAADSALLIGIYPLVTPQNNLGTHAIYNLDGIGKQIVGSSQSLFAVVICLDATSTNPATTSDMALTLATVQ